MISDHSFPVGSPVVSAQKLNAFSKSAAGAEVHLRRCAGSHFKDAEHRPGDPLHHHQDQDTSLVTHDKSWIHGLGFLGSAVSQNMGWLFFFLQRCKGPSVFILGVILTNGRSRTIAIKWLILSWIYSSKNGIDSSISWCFYLMFASWFHESHTALALETFR